MNNRLKLILLCILLALTQMGCYDQINLENARMTMILGIDLDGKNNLIVYSTSPVFTQGAKKKTSVFSAIGNTVRESRQSFDAMTPGYTIGGKVQVVLLGKKLLEHGDWFPLFDAIYRDARLTVTSRIAAVDGPIESIVMSENSELTRLSHYLSLLVESNYEKGLTVPTTIQDFHRQMYDKGMTAYIAEIKKEKEVMVKGIAILDKHAKHRTSLNLKESLMFHLLQAKETKQVSLTIPIGSNPDQEKNKMLVNKRVSFLVKHVSREVKTDYRNGRFVFTIPLSLQIALSEVVFPIDIEKQKKHLEKMIADSIQAQMMQMIRKCQMVKTDPFEMGKYARAYHYPTWKKIQDRWPETFAKAEVHVPVQVEIIGRGLTQ